LIEDDESGMCSRQLRRVTCAIFQTLFKVLRSIYLALRPERLKFGRISLPKPSRRSLYMCMYYSIQQHILTFCIVAEWQFVSTFWSFSFVQQLSCFIS